MNKNVLYYFSGCFSCDSKNPTILAVIQYAGYVNGKKLIIFLNIVNAGYFLNVATLCTIELHNYFS